jgi:hypothetical protein
VKSTMIMRPIANPRRTTLAHLQDTDELAPALEPKPASSELPPRTANPRRTILIEQLPALDLS